MDKLSVKRVGGALVVLGVSSYLLCFVWHLFVPAAFGGAILREALPGFDWTPVGFLVGLILVVLYSVYIAAVFVTAYNYLGRLGTKGRTRGTKQPVS